MRPLRGMAVVAALSCAVAAAGCGLGAGQGAGEVELTVTRDHGSELLLRETGEVRESDTVLRLLDRSAELETRYGGGFVQAIDGLSGGAQGGRRFDWFFYVNGIESPRGAAEFDLRGGDRVWWDRRDWGSAMRAPAVVGSFPQPFVGGFDGERWPAVIVCLAGGEACELARGALAEAGVEAELVDRLDDAPAGALRVLVGGWERLAGDSVASLLGRGPSRSGVFARFEGSGAGARLLPLDARGAEPLEAELGWGLVAALRPGEGPPTWVIAGAGGDDAVARAARVLTEAELEDAYALAVSPGGEALSLPLGSEGGT